MSLPGLPTWTLNLVAISISLAGCLLILALVLAAAAWSADRIVRACTEFDLIIEFLRWRKKRKPFDQVLAQERESHAKALAARDKARETYEGHLFDCGIRGVTVFAPGVEGKVLLWREGFGPNGVDAP